MKIIAIQILALLSTLLSQVEPTDEVTFQDIRRFLCSAPISSGRCRANIKRWTFNEESQQCEEFTYGGCGVAFNNFLTESECKTVCIEPLEQI